MGLKKLDGFTLLKHYDMKFMAKNLFFFLWVRIIFKCLSSAYYALHCQVASTKKYIKSWTYYSSWVFNDWNCPGVNYLDGISSTEIEVQDLVHSDEIFICNFIFDFSVCLMLSARRMLR